MSADKVKFYVVLSGSSLDRKIDFSQKNVLATSAYFLNVRGKFTRNPYIPKCQKWFLDSGGFTLMSQWRKFPFSIDDYAHLIEKKSPNLAATMDYPCEPNLDLGMSVKERIERTIDNADVLINNYDFDRKTKVIPVIQGWTVEDYKGCIDEYHRRDLLSDYVAFGSMCRRVAPSEMKKMVVKLTDRLARYGDIRAHFFGFKLSFLKDLSIQQRVYSCDSAAWTFNHDKNSGPQRRLAKNQKELEANYYAYMEKIDSALSFFDAQQTFDMLQEEEIHEL